MAEKKKKKKKESKFDFAAIPDAEKDSNPEPEIKREPVPAIPEKPKEPTLPLIALKVFSQLCGRKWDQMAGFAHYAKKNNIGPLSVPDWREQFQKFMNMPTK